MLRISRKILLTIISIITLMTIVLATDNLNVDNDSDNRSRSLIKPVAKVDEALGVMNKGQLCNLTMNYGQISDTRLSDPGNRPTDDIYNFRYPKTKPYGSMVDDFSVFFSLEKNAKNGNNGNFIDAYANDVNEDFIAKDGSLGKTHYDGSGDYPQLFYVDGVTPLLAHSDLPQTWPINDNGEPFWPGYFRRDPVTGKVFEGEFSSDRDVYGVFTDANNVGGSVIGLEIEMMAYCYGRPYAEDFQFYEFFLHNTSGDTIKQSWFGVFLDPDCGDHSEDILIVPEGYSFSDPYPIVIQRDFDGDIGGATTPNPVGRLEEMDFGVVFLETPYNIGITDFHYFADGPGGLPDEIMWPIVSGQPADPDVASSAASYFHGSNPHLDDVSLISSKSDLVYIAASGPFDFPPDDTLKFTIAVVVGNTDDDFMKNSQMAIQMFEKGFVGPAAPPGPQLWGIPGDEQVTLYWDKSSELKPDPLTGELDFEGYKIYRSEDGGVTWGDIITDSKGSVLGYVPIAQFDLQNTIQGDDPINPNNYLGDNTGLRYMYVDNVVDNGIAYSYTITAYDRGDPAANFASFESAKGVGVAEKNFVTVTPKPDPLGYQASAIYNYKQISGKGRGDVDIKIVDIQNYKNYKIQNAYTIDPIFKIKMEGSPATSFSIYDSSSANRLLVQSLPMNTGLLPVIGEIGISTTINSLQRIGGVNTITDETGIVLGGAGKLDTTKSWSVSASAIQTASLDARSNDYEIRFTATGSMAYSKGRAPVALMTVPFEVWRIYPDTAKIICEYDDKNLNGLFDDKEFIYIGNVNYPASEPSIGDSIAVNFPADFPIQVIFEKAPQTVNRPEGGNLPVEGQKVIIQCYSSFSDGSDFLPTSKYAAGDEIIFSIKEATVNNEKAISLLDEIRVVPNPYVVTSLFDPRENVRSIKFMYLPERCKITVYTLSGIKVKEIDHEDGTGIQNWDLTNEFGQDISFGVYIYHVSTPEGKNKVGKIAIIK